MAQQRSSRLTARMIQVGDRFEKLTVTGPYERRGGNNDAWFPVVCDCGNTKWLRIRSLGVSKSCGCVQKESAVRTHTKHGDGKNGDERARLYSIWAGMLTRCNNPNDTAYHLYGGRGIKVARFWSSYPRFRDWALKHGYSDDLVLDRIDNDGPYCPLNCHWITNQQNQWNRRNNRLLTAWGEIKCLAEWAQDERCQVSQKTLWTRLKNKWPDQLAIETPSLGSGHRRFEVGI